jgi:hypothetical protein
MSSRVNPWTRRQLATRELNMHVTLRESDRTSSAKPILAPELEAKYMMGMRRVIANWQTAWKTASSSSPKDPVQVIKIHDIYCACTWFLLPWTGHILTVCMWSQVEVIKYDFLVCIIVVPSVIISHIHDCYSVHWHLLVSDTVNLNKPWSQKSWELLRLYMILIYIYMTRHGLRPVWQLACEKPLYT